VSLNTGPTNELKAMNDQNVIRNLIILKAISWHVYSFLKKNFVLIDSYYSHLIDLSAKVFTFSSEGVGVITPLADLELIYKNISNGKFLYE